MCRFPAARRLEPAGPHGSDARPRCPGRILRRCSLAAPPTRHFPSPRRFFIFNPREGNDDVERHRAPGAHSLLWATGAGHLPSDSHKGIWARTESGSHSRKECRPLCRHSYFLSYLVSLILRLSLAFILFFYILP